jgi:hypothetical protein
MFEETSSHRGDWISTTEIVRAWEDDNCRAVVELRNGQKETLEYISLDQLSRSAQPVFPALPGFELLTASLRGKEVGVARQPVIGWRIGQYGPEPVVVDPWFEDIASSQSVIRFPDGQVTALGDRSYDNEAEWRADMELRHKAMEEERQAEKSLESAG